MMASGVGQELSGRAALGVWRENPVLVHMLGLCPLLAVTTTAVNGLALGIASLFVVALTNVTVSGFRRWLNPSLRLPIFVLIIASIVSAVELLLNGFFHELYRVLGLFIPLIVTNCMILGRAESYASRQPVWPALVDGLTTGLGFLGVLVSLGAIREILGQGTLGQGLNLIFGPDAPGGLRLVDDGLLLMVLPPGAFFGLAVLVALFQRRTRSSTNQAN